MFISMRSGTSPTHAKIFQYELSVNFSISSATYNGTFFSAANEITKLFVSFDLSHDGKMLYVTDGALDGTSTESVYQYSLSRAFDLSSTITLLRSRDLEAHFDTLVPATGETVSYTHLTLPTTGIV